MKRNTTKSPKVCKKDAPKCDVCRGTGESQDDTYPVCVDCGGTGEQPKSVYVVLGEVRQQLADLQKRERESLVTTRQNAMQWVEMNSGLKEEHHALAYAAYCCAIDHVWQELAKVSR